MASQLLKPDRFARHRLIPGFDQSLVCSLKIALVGAGAIGNEVLKNLLLMGVGAVDVYDFDTTEESNLTRSVFLRSSDVGLNKAQAVVARAHELHPDTQLTAIAGDIFDTLGLSRLKKYDLLFCAVDNFEARLRLNEMTRITGTPWINLAIDSRRVVVEIYPATRALLENNKPAPCYACGLPQSTYERIAKRYSCGGLARAAHLEKTVPTTAVTASISGALGVSEALRLMHHAGEASTQRIFLDVELPSTQRTQLATNPDCPTCSEHGAFPIPTDLADVPQISTELLQSDWLKNLANTDEAVLFSDAIITRAQCVTCGPSPQLSALIGLRAKSISDSVIRCQSCSLDSVSIEFTEMGAISELLSDGVPLKDRQPAWLQHGRFFYDRLL